METGRKVLRQKVKSQQHTWTRCNVGIPAQLAATAVAKEKTMDQEEVKWGSRDMWFRRWDEELTCSVKYSACF